MNETEALKGLCGILAKYLIPYIKDAFVEECKPQVEKKDEDKLFTKQETMGLLGVSNPTLWRWEKAGYLIPIRIGGKIYYSQTQIEKLKEA